jgi:hypothetical protein
VPSVRDAVTAPIPRGYKAELFFRLFDLLLRQLALRELMNTADNATGMATGVTNGFGTQPNPRDRAIRPNDSAFEIL